MESSNALFINAYALNLFDLMNFKIMQLMYKVKNNLLPHCIQRLLKARESQYQLRKIIMFKKPRVRTNGGTVVTRNLLYLKEQ